MGGIITEGARVISGKESWKAGQSRLCMAAMFVVLDFGKATWEIDMHVDKQHHSHRLERL